MAGWKTKYLSLAGRMTLINAIVAAISAYIMQIARLPRSICDELDRKILRFLWGGNTLHRKPHLVSWDVVTKEKIQGGLGVRSMRQLNSAFLMKLGWRLHTEPSTLWTRILKEKYGRGRQLLDLVDRRSSCSNAWKGIMDTMKWTEKGMGYAISDGRSTKFWVHRWLDSTKLEEQATDAIPPEHLQRRICDYWNPVSGWDWEQFASLLPITVVQRIASFVLAAGGISDEWVWLLDKSGKFTL